MNGPVVRVGVLGCGTVGSSLIALVQRQRATIASRTGLQLDVSRVAVRDAGRPRPVELPTEALHHRRRRRSSPTPRSTSWSSSSAASSRPARSCSRPSPPASRSSPPTRSCSPPTAPSCSPPPRPSGVDLLFEAAVAGGIPIVRPLRESLLGEPVHRVLGIVNGTTNYILTRMTEAGADYADALAEAQALGYAEADPTADVEGHDAGAKIAIVATIAFGADVTADDVVPEGISGITAADIAFAGRHGFVVKLLAIAELVDGADGPEIGVRVHPVLVPETHPLASVRESFNAVFVAGRRRRRPHVLRPGRRRRPHRQRRARRPHRRRRQPQQRGPRLHRPSRSRPASARSTSRRRPTTSASRSPTGPACSPPSPASSASTGCRSARWSRRAAPTRAGPASCSSPTWPSSATCGPPSTRSASLDVVHQVGSVIQVLTSEEAES